MREPGRFRDPTLVRIRRPDRTDGAALPVAHEKGRDPRLWCEFCRLAFPSRVPDACDPRGSSEYTAQYIIPLLCYAQLRPTDLSLSKKRFGFCHHI